ncbi:MAG: hypothetical protein KGI28_05545 [Thaumarchaeota archaeon]|nr:hypothetical protein [Nitrososphaerota archaeon]
MSPKKLILIGLGIFVGMLLAFGASDMTLVLKEKTQAQKDFFNLIARLASIASISVLVLTRLKKIPMRPTWSYFVTGAAATFTVFNLVIIPLVPGLSG